MRLFAIVFLLMFLLTSPAVGQSWGSDDRSVPPVAVAVPVEAQVVPDTSLAAAASDVAGRRGLTRKQKRDMGLTTIGILKTLRAIHADGELEGRDNSIIAADVLSRSAAANPKAFLDANAGVDEEFWSRVIEWIEKLLPFLLILLSFMS